MLKVVNKNAYTGGLLSLRLAFFLFAFTLFDLSPCLAQKYTFSHYDIEDGLIESQVNNLNLDNQHRLWMATLGGATRFDGKEFTSYTRQNGMPTNIVNSVFTDKSGTVWFGTQKGLGRLVNNKLSVFPMHAKLRNQRVTSIVQDENGTVWFLMSNRLFKVEHDAAKAQMITETMDQPIICLGVNKVGRLFASVFHKGIYYLDNGKWQIMAPIPAGEDNLVIRSILFDDKDSQKLYLLGFKGVFVLSNGQITSYQDKLISSIKDPLFCFGRDTESNLWIGTSNGAYLIKNGELIHFTASNGLTDISVSDIYKDPDDNLWLGTQGNGFFKYEGDRFVTFDKSQGIPGNEVVMGVTKDKMGRILLGISGVGLMQYNGKTLSLPKLPSGKSQLTGVQCLYTDKAGTTWICGDQGGLWSYNGNTLTMINGSNFFINGLTEDENGKIWASSPAGCFFVENNTLVPVKEFYSYASAIQYAGKDSIMVGTQDGVMLMVKGKVVTSFKLTEIKTSTVFCMIRYKDMMVIGTDDRGIFTWNKITGQVKNYTTKEGLNSNTIFSLATDENSVIWTGTGRGVNRLFFDRDNNGFNISGNGGSKNLIVESNQNAILYADHKVWIGTTRGVVAYDVNASPLRSSPPHIIIESVKLIPQASGNDKMESTTLTEGAKLSYNNSHLAISFRGIYLKDPEGISYRYKLQGQDSSYSQPVKNNEVDYPSLPAGKYTFKVMAITGNGVISAETADFSFSVTPPFYQTITFRTAAILFFVLLGILLQSYRHRVRINRQKIIEATKREESLKIRQQTAEDFHDELGNKLTRITVLSEILDTKMDDTQADQKKLLEQIKQNASSLYNGTKDILWALDPQSDNLYEILNHIKDFGKELFLDTAVEFEFNGIDESLNGIKLPMEYSRNIPMIFKELLNNTLKHAQASSVKITLDKIKGDQLHLTLSDNGQGFDQQTARKGQGINNITTRIKRIGGNISIFSEKGNGTLINLRININPVVTH